MCLLVSTIVPRVPTLRVDDGREIGLDENDSAEWTIGSSKIDTGSP